jgi:hypothetical protein
MHLLVFVILLSLHRAAAQTNCGIGTDPFFATISYAPKTDMWRANIINIEYNDKEEQIFSSSQQHWETRYISKKCVITRTVYMIIDRNVHIYQQKIYPAVNNIYRVDEYNPLVRKFQAINNNVQRVDANTVNITGEWMRNRQLIIDVPHHSYYERMEIAKSGVYISCTVVLPSEQDVKIRMARNAFERGTKLKVATEPFISFVYSE